jgi:hypothetical protein
MKDPGPDAVHESDAADHAGGGAGGDAAILEKFEFQAARKSWFGSGLAIAHLAISHEVADLGGEPTHKSFLLSDTYRDSLVRFAHQMMSR